MDIDQLAEKIIEGGTRNAAVSGAGMSVESGVAPFRGKGGLWEKMDPMKVAHIDAFREDPVPYWEMRGPFIKSLETIDPNPGHAALARLQREGRLGTIITQNIDGLHEAAGSTDVIEFHGSVRTLRCMDCSRKIPSRSACLDDRPPRCACGGVLRPDVVFFGEAIPPEALVRSQQIASDCPVMLVVGTSAVVQPAASIPVIARRAGALVVEINPERTPLTDQVVDVFLEGWSGEVLPALAEAVRRASC
ncbi:MAG: NAD-dependent deacylase [Deltaproteobacteria bacterium]|nr:NAD-dependent deacylase [Deltaproteobacteria bacterium]